jgi:hypothetical protein
VPYAAVELSNGTTVEGVLHDYTWAPDVTHRDIALAKPIRVTKEGETKEPDYDFLVVPGNEVRHIALQYVQR